MSRWRQRGILCLAVALAAAGLGAGSGGRAASATTAAAPAAVPVASLEPAATMRLWRRLVRRRALPVAADCRPLRGIFYASTDWLRLATKLAASQSPCAQYYISIPPSSDKTQPRSDQAARVRALGPNFHAMAEIHFAGWSRWVATTGSTWFAAGVTARERMAAAGFDVSKGDTWAVNEFTSAVRRGDGAARANARDFVRGLFEGDGQQVRGTVFVIGVGQTTPDVSIYQTNLQNWLPDGAFWTDMSTYVSDWSQEVYPDFRAYAVPGAPITARRDYLNDFLQHELVLQAVGPPTIDVARSYLQAAYSPLANAAWQWNFGYGWTVVATDQMQNFVSAQTYALRSFSAITGQPQDHWGFAWSPRNATGIAPGDFAAQTGAILDRLAAAVRDSGEPLDPNDPGSGACGPPGQNLWCGGDLDGARFTEAWKSLKAWTQPVLAFTTPPQTISAGAPTSALGVALLSTAGAPQVAPAPIPVALISTSAQAMFSTSPSGPWSTTLTATIPAGGGASEAFYYQDTRAGGPELKAASAGYTTAYQPETVTPGPVTSIALTPASATLVPRASQEFAAAATDAFGNPAPVTPTWSVTPPTLGTITPQPDAKALFTAGFRGGSGTVTAAVSTDSGTVSGTAKVTVQPGRLKVASIRYGIGRNALLVTPKVISGGGRPVAGARISILVRRNGGRYFTGRATSAENGRATFRLPRARGGCYTTIVRSAAAAGFVWDRKTPRNRFCK